MLTSVHVSDDSAFCAPSAASAALLVKAFSRVNSMALLLVVVLGSNDSMLNGWNAPATMPAFRCGATVVSEPVSVFLTSTRSLLRLPPAKSPYRADLMNCSPQLSAAGFSSCFCVPFCSICKMRSASSRCLIARPSTAALVSAEVLPAFFSSASVLSANLTSCASMASQAFITAAISLMFFAP